VVEQILDPIKKKKKKKKFFHMPKTKTFRYYFPKDISRKEDLVK
jgi:hypothetical protein